MTPQVVSGNALSSVPRVPGGKASQSTAPGRWPSLSHAGDGHSHRSLPRGSTRPEKPMSTGDFVPLPCFCEAAS